MKDNVTLQELNDSMNTAKAELDVIRNSQYEMNPVIYARLERFAENRYNQVLDNIELLIKGK